ncbi:hypothetical protein PHYSODRAFT_327150 [Phytophthora sojae]|uniref:Uncharacterized protein n=1 Tax=Phytophthora sojae (strain P6497) TaxID=1094619 RepID=G4YY68_PHYSP|nr:hypothetical protein PHYSODRAFT_327150 [Phytophthora sojae]EGZ26236.1 hypothetical protein PHYSODRAFT_327150 [Phytophthora sojae]|eukprot:XP_009521524.1 hypothetical protein PHYSODRAFT_327150 [Phytophthora sojae]
MTHGYMSMINDTSYNTTTLADLELVVVVVDGSFTQLVAGDLSTVRIFNLVRSREDSRDLYLVTVSLTAQDYEIREHEKEGPALLGILSVMRDMRQGIIEMFYMMALTYPYQRTPEFEIYSFVGISDESFLELRSTPKDPLTQPVNLVLRGVLVVISWYLNSFWTLFEFAMSNAAIVSGTDIVRVHRELVHADVLVVYLGLVALLSAAIRERIDPSIAIFLFEIIHKNRLSLIRGSPAVRNEVVEYSDSLFSLRNSNVSPVVEAMSPLNYWTAFQIPSKDGTFLAASFFPKITLLGTIAFYAVLRKVYRYIFPEEIRQRSSQSAEQSANEKTALLLKGNLTNFEISTGAELQTRFGIISDYKNYVYFKGYVIVNGKFLIKSKALPAVVTIKLLRSRFTNVYVYEVDGNTVKDTARLVFPETFSWSDLWRLNLTVLL